MLGNETREALGLPKWVPIGVTHYLAHTVAGQSIRAIARAHDCHPSTILRQVRRLEARRDDPLVDAALRTLLPNSSICPNHTNREPKTMSTPLASHHVTPMNDSLNQTRIDREALRVLRRLCEPKAVLAVARDMDTAVVVREDATGASVRTAVVEREIAQAMALKTWIQCTDPDARIARYFVTNQGREELRRLTAQEENHANGFRKSGHDKRDASHAWDLREDMGGGTRYMVTESPLIGLARRKDRDGQQFLDKDQVTAGERLRQDYELSRLALRESEDWQLEMRKIDTDLPTAVAEARARVVLALTHLGPGLGDVVLRCCCLLEGLEKAEKALGWSSRSGKIVLRIGLTQLVRHYRDTQGAYEPMIG